MPEAKSHIGSWGGRRKGAGRKRELTVSNRRKIASYYHARMQKIRDLGNTPCREAAIRKLMAECGATHRMVERCLAEFLPAIRLYLYATKGADEIQPLPARKIEKLKPGIYNDKKLSLRLIVDSAGNRKWFFRFVRGPRRSAVITDKMLGGSELSLATARELATKAHRMVAAGQDP
jgi:hypothetical protein